MDVRPDISGGGAGSGDRRWFGFCSSRLRADRGLEILLIVGTFVLYGVVLRSGEFVWDDLVLLDQNSLLRGESNWFTLWWREDFPLSVAAFALLHELCGRSARAFHWINVGLHAFASVLLGRVLRAAGVPGASWGALWFAWHPMCVMSAAWVSEIKNTLSLGLFLLSARLWLVYGHTELQPNVGLLGRGESRKAWRWGLAAWLVFALALLAKTSAVALPVLLAAWGYWRAGFHDERLWRSLVPFFLLGLVMGIRTIWLHHHQVLVDPQVVPELDGIQRLLRAAWIWWFYLVKAVAPMHLCVIYPAPNLHPQLWLSWLPLIGLLVAVGVAARLAAAGRRGLVVWVIGYGAAVFPFLGFVDMYFFAISPVSDHFAYVALAIMAAGVGFAAHRWQAWSLRLPMNRRLMIGGPILLCGICALGVFTADRARVFVQEKTLWETALRCHPQAWVAHNNLGVWWAERGDLVRAEQHFQEALRLFPRNPAARVNLARIWMNQGRWQEAVLELRQALEIRPDAAEAHRLLGQAFEAQGQFREAITALQSALALEEDVGTRLALASFLRRMGDWHGTVRELDLALTRHPDDPEVMNNLAWVLATSPEPELRDPTRAVALAQRACALRPEVPVFRGTLAAALASAGQFQEAAKVAEEAAIMAERDGHLPFAKLNRRLAALYQEGKAYIEPRLR
ncbi:MAG: tetratricopeptide repeat protein [Verrucomicrobiota bacterium]|nr:tetratricopeptide repeat protein [Limisphaera sp.]MDW8381607.1 tetratricopeptide repeat protein [Verrucomicrobiota bacterium]